MDLVQYSEEELLRDGRAALRSGRHTQAATFLAEYCRRLEHDGRIVPAGIMADLGLAVGMSRRVKEGIGICELALSRERRNPEVYLCLSQLYVRAGSKKKAIEMMQKGLRLSPEHVALKQLHGQIGIRQSPPVAFLPRGNALNVKIGRFLHRLRGRSRTRTA